MKESPSIITVLLVLPLLQVHSQNLEGNHTYRIGDKVEKQLVEYELNDESAKNVVWDLRDLSDLDGKHKVVYTDVESWGLNDPCEYGANIRQICRITGVSYGVIYRAKVNH